MSKSRYKCVQFKTVEWSEVAGRLGGKRVVVAVDVAKEDFVATLVGADQEAVVTFGWRHPQETGVVVDRLVELRAGRQLEAVLEPIGTYGDALVWQFWQAGIEVYRVSPKRVHDAAEVYAEVYDGLPSLHDAKAAYLIGRFHLEGTSQVWAEPGEERRPVKAVLTQLRVSKGRQQSASNRLEAQLSRHRPESLGILGLKRQPCRCCLRPMMVIRRRWQPMARARRLGAREEKIAALVGSAGKSLGVLCLGAERELLQ